MRVTQDKYQLPIAVATSQKELATTLGVSLRTVAYGMQLHRAGFLKIYVDLEEGEKL